MKRILWAGLAVIAVATLLLLGFTRDDSTEIDKEAVRNALKFTTPKPLKPGEKPKGMLAPPP